MKNLLRASIFALSVIGLMAAPTAAKDKYPNGEIVEIRGTVTDPNGEVLEGVKVVLEASRKSFRISKFGKAVVGTTKLAADTDSSGSYVIRWPWDNYYNTFTVSAGVPVRKATGFEIEPLAVEDISRRIGHGSPIVAPLVIENSSFVRNLQTFVASLDTHDEMRIYERMGKPDKIEQMTFPTHQESTWWYFKSGKTYRFDNGSLLGVSEFDPVEPF